MLANVFTKSVRDRQIAVLVAVVGVSLVTLLGMAAYNDLDETIAQLYSAMPEGFLSLLNLGGVDSVGGLILGEVANLMAPVALAGLAISMGAAAIAGEEAEGTIAVLLGNPRSRRSVLLSKTTAMTALLGVGAVLTWALSYWVATWFDTDMSLYHFGAAMFHVFAIALFFGTFALFLGSWTGRRVTASGSATGLLILSFLAAGLLPLVDSVADLAKIFPWYYFNSSAPLANGVDWGDLSILFGASLVLVALSIVGVQRRDLRIGEGGGSLIQRIRANPMAAKVLDRISGNAKVSSITIKTTTEFQAVATVASIAVLYTALLVGPLFNALGDVLVDMMAAIPDAVLGMIGFADMSTPDGWYWGEVFSLVVPVSMIVVTVMMGARALAGEEELGSMDLLLANPIPRTRVVFGKTAAMVIVTLGVGVATFLGTAAGAWLGGLDMSYANIAVASLMSVLLALGFGGLALLVGGFSGKRRVASYTAAGAATVAYFANAFLPVSATLSGWARLSPFFWYGQNQPLSNGIDWGDAAVLAGIAVVLVGLAAVAFQRRDVAT
jgi:ABC-2 type transport system permease protein